VEVRAELATCHASGREAAAEIGTLSVEATVAETLSGLATIYLAAEAFFRPIWGRYFTTEYPPDRSTPTLPRLIYVHYYLYLQSFSLLGSWPGCRTGPWRRSACAGREFGGPGGTPTPPARRDVRDARLVITLIGTVTQVWAAFIS
jgi:hypothetical protein